MHILDSLVSLYAPHACAGCGREGAVLCKPCQAHLSLAVRRCYRCHAADDNSRTCVSCRRHGGPVRVRIACRYEGAAKDALWQLKFGYARSTAKDIATVMAPLFEDYRDLNYIVVHIPTATSRVRMRGYDQARLIARACARQADLPHASLLLRLGQQRQVGLKRQQRLSQLEQAFEIRNTERVRGAHIMLVDDVVTTGATLEAATKVLKAAGANRVEAIAFAQA